MHVTRDTIWVCLYPIFTRSSPLTERVDCVSMAIRVYSLCENWRRVMIAVSLCWHCQAITFGTILNHTDYLQSYFRDWVCWQLLGCVDDFTMHFLCLGEGPVEFSFRITNPTAEGWVSQELNIDISDCRVFATQAFSSISKKKESFE